jgi:hypothetical protein
MLITKKAKSVQASRELNVLKAVISYGNHRDPSHVHIIGQGLCALSVQELHPAPCKPQHLDRS